jgi:NADH-quinone oxidoreductase subunit L
MNWLDANYLPWLIPLPPLIAFAFIVLFAGRSRPLTHVIAITGVVTSWVLSFMVVNHVFGSSLDWLANGTNGALRMGVMVDPLTVVMLFMVPLAVLLIFIYSLGYMAHDPRNTRFFAYLSLFAGAMLTLVVADNLLLLFVGWEVMGLCSYLLIGFYYEKPSAYRAAMKAFLTTRVADVLFMLGIAYLWASTGTLNFRDILHSEEVLATLGSTPALGGFLGLTASGLIGIFIVAGTIGKSAQFPAHVWLPDAMAGPTPVSAMIHAAAMVSAGVYLVIRMFPLFAAGGHVHDGELTAPLILMAVVGSFTALFASTIAITQNDIKKVLAYSTISQLGFMVAALGIGAYVAAFFHLITHAFFKALLFLGSGSVIHAMEHGHHVAHGHHGGHGHDEHAHDDHGHGHDAHPSQHEADHGTTAHGTSAHGSTSHGHAAHGDHGHHDEVPYDPEYEPVTEFDPQDMRNMGGLWRKMPVTTATFVIGGAALMGFPLITAGFWSKDEIFLEAVYMSGKTPIALLVLLSLALAAIMTTVYTIRQIWMTFFGAPRTEAAQYAEHNDGTTSGRNVSAQLTAPLIVLAFFAIFAGFAGVNPAFPILGPALAGVGIEKPFVNFVERSLLEPPAHPEFTLLPVAVSFGVFILGAIAGYMLYIRRPYRVDQPDPVVGVVGPDLYRVMQNKYYVDEFYALYFVRPMKWIADTFVNLILDKGIIDGIIHFVARAATYIGNLFREFNRVVIDGVGDGIPEAIADAARGLRTVQSGRIQQYLLYALAAAIWIGVNLVILVVFPNLVAGAALVQVAAAVIIVLLTSGSTDTRSSEQ